jgi:hypothetical protein
VEEERALKGIPFLGPLKTELEHVSSEIVERVLLDKSMFFI